MHQHRHHRFRLPFVSLPAATAVAAIILAIAPGSYAQCPNLPALTPNNSIQITTAQGYDAAVIAANLTAPRSLQFDSAGHLLVLEQASGLSSHTLMDQGGTCVRFAESKVLIKDANLTHGLTLSPDETILYVSSSDQVYAYSYNASTSSVGSTRKVLITGMQGTDHTTRTLLYPLLVNDTLVVSRGSTENVDPGAMTESTGISQVKAFNLSSIPDGGVNFADAGTLLGWGLRNDVGIVEHPVSGGIWSVENSVDQLERDGVDVHQDNPGEELNFLGYLNGTIDPGQGTNFGYPQCLAAWDPSTLPGNASLTVGTQFTTSSTNDSQCANRTAPRLTFQAHMAPLDIKFNSSASEAWISFHGSWDRTDPVGYHVSHLSFSQSTYEPTDSNTSTTSLTTIFSNANNTVCPDHCFRPVGMAFDRQGRLFVASDASGEVYVVVNTGAGNGSGSGNATGSGSGPSATTSGMGGATSSSAATAIAAAAAAGGSGSLGMAMTLGVLLWSGLWMAWGVGFVI